MPERQLKQVMLKCGQHHLSAALFYHRLWRQHLRNIGFHIILLEKLEQHEMWVIRVRITASAQLRLLAGKAPVRNLMKANDPFVHQLTGEVREFAASLGPPIAKDYLSVTRTGAYCTIAFMWPRGKPGRLLRKQQVTTAFSLMIRSWLKQVRN